jgi:hypothetical protein
MSRWFFLAIFAVCILPGCSREAAKPTVRLAGAILIDGQPIPADAVGSIRFEPTQLTQGAVADVEIVNGRYDAPAVPKGHVTVRISVKKFTGNMIQGIGEPAMEFKSLVPEKYSSGFALYVAADSDRQDFNLAE